MVWFGVADANLDSFWLVVICWLDCVVFSFACDCYSYLVVVG